MQVSTLFLFKNFVLLVWFIIWAYWNIFHLDAVISYIISHSSLYELIDK